MSVFELDENKTPLQLSEGMRVKLNLTVALSHSSELLILDEPTSGLDPVSREELLEIFTALRGRGMTILFSTHITSDLEKCADRICYIRRGRIIVCRELDGFTASCAEEGRGNSLDEIMLSYEKEDYREKLA